jgi:Tfp pilus assembly major pilin PilA
MLIAAALIVPLYSDYTARAKASEAIYSARPLQDLVASRAIELKSLSGSGIGVGAGIKGTNGETIILPEGIIILRVPNSGQILVLLPSYEGGSVTWRCMGGSARDVPVQCRNLI